MFFPSAEFGQEGARVYPGGGKLPLGTRIAWILLLEEMEAVWPDIQEGKWGGVWVPGS